MRLIDRKDLARAMAEDPLLDMAMVLHILLATDGCPVVDAVPVVRCKDCEHMCRDNVGVFCKVWNGYNGCGYDGFCNYGEKREPK